MTLQPEAPSHPAERNEWSRRQVSGIGFSLALQRISESKYDDSAVDLHLNSCLTKRFHYFYSYSPSAKPTLNPPTPSRRVLIGYRGPKKKPKSASCPFTVKGGGGTTRRLGAGWEPTWQEDLRLQATRVLRLRGFFLVDFFPYPKSNPNALKP